MLIHEPISILPLVSTIVWLTLAVRLVSVDRFRTWTEVFLLLTLVCGGMFAFSDFLFFNSETPADVFFTVRFGLSWLTIAAVSFALYGVVLASRMRRWFLALYLPAIPALIVIWSSLLVGVAPVATGVPQLVAVYNRPPFIAWLVYAFLYVVVGVTALLRLSLILGRRKEPGARQLWMFAIAWTLVIVLGAATNTTRALLEARVPPLFGTLLVIPGVMAFRTAAPVSGARVQDAIRRWKASRYSVQSVFAIYSAGTLIASRTGAGGVTVDHDIFAATWDLISNRLRVGMERSRATWLRSISHGDHTILVERGRHASLLLVIRGEETDPLRRLIRDSLLDFESKNEDVLADWDGRVDAIRGADEMLSEFLPPAAT